MKRLVTGVRQMQTADLQTCRPADLQTCRPAELQTCRPADLQTWWTQYTGLSQFILKIILCNLRHSTSCAVRLVRFKATWLLSRLSFRTTVKTCRPAYFRIFATLAEFNENYMLSVVDSMECCWFTSSPHLVRSSDIIPCWGMCCLRNLRTVVSNFRESGDRSENSNFFLFAPKDPFGELFSKIIFKSSSEFFFRQKLGKFKIGLNVPDARLKLCKLVHF